MFERVRANAMLTSSEVTSSIKLSSKCCTGVAKMLDREGTWENERHTSNTSSAVSAETMETLARLALALNYVHDKFVRMRYNISTHDGAAPKGEHTSVALGPAWFSLRFFATYAAAPINITPKTLHHNITRTPQARTELGRMAGLASATQVIIN